ncbi:phospho-2-dehydro-3-deoxyheptonate aldolase [Pseudoscardovia radai]|uniref:Phospho-2-dehydro-3-deoxyheptonate aldolase n=1 Tax=Pseudoscardovia radai TaxID=987066 RepID=A0A261F091_9BIFI|nr:3-deoxy-7-phosphoheptulonate synthase [Pseudoscardovia radai]OZG52508.1 phospho-2-dehydro-3-deoxyheptonate aldolase [Pseudoscardovia radai]
MTVLRGPDSSEDRAQLGSQAVLPETVDVNIRQLDPIPAPRAFINELPITHDVIRLVQDSRRQISDVLHGRDDRLLVIVGPCSIHDPKAAKDYANRLGELKSQLSDDLLIVMRVYFEKPRTTIGWKGLINDPDLDGTFNIRKGMWLARRILLDVADQGLPAATEWLDPITPQYLCDLVSWGAIGARNTESQVHRELASGMSMPIGFKNSTDGNVKAAADSCFASANEHHFLSINLDGHVIAAETKGNPDCHVILRGSNHGPNYSAESVAEALEALRNMHVGEAASHGVVIDAAHGNSGKNEIREAEVVEQLATRIANGEPGISGIMMESFIEGGHQDPAPLGQLVYGRSVTDRCIAWPRTEELLRKLASAVRMRRNRLSE